MVSETRLHDAFGELIYAVALADGMIQPEELGKIKEVLLKHPWGSGIQWSFDYESRKKTDPKEAYEKALDVLKENGPHPEYIFLVDILEQIAAASERVDASERAIIDGFQTSLKEHFLKYLDENNLRI